jgi:hypothetical protein
MPLISRRKIMALGVTAGAAAFLPPLLSRKSAAQSSVLIAGDLLAVTPMSDPSSEMVFGNLFSGLFSDRGFQQLRPLTFFVTNVTQNDIRAFSSRWAVRTLAGESKMDIMHYFHPRAAHNWRQSMRWGMRGDRTRVTGNVPMIKAGATRLVTPFFNLSSAGYKTYKTDEKRLWTDFFLRRPTAALSQAASTGARVTMTINAAITNDYTPVGPNDEHLASTFFVTRNAEHDEALAVLKRIAAGATREQVRHYLRGGLEGGDFKFRTDSRYDNIYFIVRKRQARVLLRRLKRASWDQFLGTLQYMSSLPITKRLATPSAPQYPSAEE